MRAFIGFKVPEKLVIEKIRQLEKLSYAKTVEPENLHVCLKFFEEINDGDIEKVKKAMQVLKGKFKVQLKGISAFPNKDHPKVVKIDVISDEMKSLQAKLENELEKFGFAKENREFAPHLTLARIKAKPDDSLKKIFDDKDYGSFNIDKAELISSELTPQGPIYKTVYTYGL